MSTITATELRGGGADVELLVAGELDLESAPQLLAWADALDPSVRRVIVDLTAVTFLDSSGISALIGLHRAFEPQYRTLMVRGAVGQPREVLDMSGIGEVLHVIA